jgi:hypothetical protein
MRRVLTVSLIVASSLAGGTIAGSASSGIARNPVGAADWKIWMAKESGLVRLNQDKIAPQYAKCAKLKRAAAIGICDAKPLSQQAQGIASYVAALGDFVGRTHPGQCRSAILRYELALQAAVSAAIVTNKELIMANKVLWKSALALEKQIKHALGVDSARAKTLCKP